MQRNTNTFGESSYTFWPAFSQQGAAERSRTPLGHRASCFRMRALHVLFALLVATAAALAAVRPTLRELVFSVTGFILAHVIRRRFDLAQRLQRALGALGRSDVSQVLLRNEFVVSDVSALREMIPAGLSGSCVADATKVIAHLDEQMVGFVRRSPFVQLATVDATGQPFVSPKGDSPGFVEVVEQEGRGVALRIADRPGNRLVFGLQNALQGARRVGLCFVIPGNGTTLRCGGRATLSRDPQLLERHAARGLDAKLVIQVSAWVSK